MSEKKKIIITIARQYGSGGADTGKKLAEDLGISFYDKNILRMNSDESGIKESYFHLADEKAGNRLLYKIINTLTPEKGAPSFGSDLISADNLFRFQSEVIRKLAAEESCVIIGRCADYALADNPNHLSIFIHAPMDVRIQRVAKRQNITPEKARSLIIKTDKRRASYYEYYSSQKWGAVESYDFCMDSSYLGLGGTVELIRAMVEHKEHPILSPTEEDPTRPAEK